MKKFILILSMVNLFLYQSNAQVKTHILSERENINYYFPYHIDNSVNFIDIPKPDIDSVYAEDDRLNRQLVRFAVKVKTDISEKDGTFIENGYFTTWKLGIYSDGAASLNLKFQNLTLPDGAEMILYSSDEKMMIGTIKNSNIKKGQIMTSMINSDKAIIEIVIPKDSKDLFSLNIEFISYGISEYPLSNIALRGFNDSEACIKGNNIICPQFDEWYNHGNGISRVLIGGQWWCSGSLITNECNVDRSFFLTAFHCLDINEDGEIVFDELINLNNTTFEFDYESPDCTPSSEPLSWVTYSRAEMLAGWNNIAGTDFLLLEISDPAHIENTPNTINHTPDINDTKVACIQHPIGDLKKIAVDNDPVIMDGLYWHVEDWQTGSTQDGSSGSPLFDANHQIVGQDSRGDGPQPCDPDKGTFFGRTDKSWFGNGTDESSLEPWLGGTRPPDFDKYAGENYFINGPDIVCDYAQFCNDNSATGNVHWTVSPHSAFYPPYEGNTSCANIRVNKNFNGYATITFTSTYPYGDCSFDGSIQKQFWIGDPDFTLTGDQSLCLFDIGVAFINPISPYTGDTQWSIGGAISGIGAGLKAKYKSSNQPGWGWICATMTNECGVTEKCIWVSVEDCEGGWDKNRLIISPVPSKDILYIKIEDLALSQTNTSIDVYIMDISSGKIINKDKYYSDSFNIDVSNLQNGVYLLKTISGSNEVLFSKFVVLK